MKCSIRWAVCAAVLVLLPWTGLSAQGGGPTPRSACENLWGPVVGVVYVAASQSEFNEALQRMYPNAERDYVPLLTQFGLNFEQRIRLGGSGSHFAFQETFMVGGIDQGMALPSVSVQVGFRSRRGPQFGLGPILLASWTRADMEVSLSVSVVYSLGWGFSFHDAYVPLSIAVVPTPGDGNPTFGVFSGFELIRPARGR
jgi:hypothetical protein